MKVIKLLLILFLPVSLIGQVFEIESPDGKLTAKIEVSKDITWQLLSDKGPIFFPSKIEMQVNDNQLWGKDAELLHSEKGNEIERLKPVYQIRSEIVDNYNYLKLKFKSYSLEFRLYDRGYAYRFIGQSEEELIVNKETAEFNLSGNHSIWFVKTQDFQQPFEGEYKKYKGGELATGEFSITPVTIKNYNNYNLVITDANIVSYPGMFVEKVDGEQYKARFAPYVSKEKVQFMGKVSPVKMPYYTKMMAKDREPFLAKTSGKRTFPWRVVLVEKTDKDLLNNTLVYQLADECKIKDPSWIKPGVVVWDWYHYWKIPNVDFKSGVNNETYRYYVDFAAKNGFEYINIDFSWSPLLKLDKPKGKVGLHDIISYANSKDVGAFIWVVWYELDEKMEYYLDLFQKWGVAGLKVDFMDRDDQRVVEFYHRLAEEAAKRKLLLNLHGAYKPDGISRTWPNVINREGVIGLENNKFGTAATPEHNLTIPFTRNVVGPVDYTPGAMRHTTPEEYEKSWGDPHAMTTRCQQLAMYVVYYGPLQMIADAPTLYPKKALTFLKEVPTCWDETIPLDANIGEKAIVARRKGDRWFIGGMCASNTVNQLLKTNFLDPGDYTARIWQDGKRLEDIEYSEGDLSRGDLLNIRMKPNGGIVIILEPK